MRRRRRRRRRSRRKRSTKEKQTATVLLNLTRLFVWLHYYHIYLIETKGQQSGRLLPTHSSLQPKLT